MPLRTWNGSSFLTSKSARVWDGSSWVNAKSAKVWNGSSWVNFLSSVNIEDQFISISAAGFDFAESTSGYILNANGVASALEIGDFTFNEYDFPGEWLVGGVASDFSVKVDILSSFNSGTATFFGNTGVWESLSSTRSWTLVVSASGNDQFEEAQYQLNVQLAYTVDTSTIIDTAEILLSGSASTA